MRYENSQRKAAPDETAAQDGRAAAQDGRAAAQDGRAAGRDGRAGAGGKRADRRRPRLARYFLLPAVLLAAFLLHGEILQYALLGHDTYPIIAASRVHDAPSLAGTFTEELMDGRFPKGHFYRPLLNLSFALDHALWGLDAFGYHLTDLLLLGLCVFFTAAFPFPGRKGWTPAALAAGLFLVAHPVWGDILPVAPRRGDILALLFILLAIRSLESKGRLRAYGPALFTLLAVAAKETGGLALPLLFVWRLLHPQPGGKPRLVQAARAAALPLGALLLYLIARQTVLGGLEGQGIFTARSFLDQALFTLPRLLGLTLLPGPAAASVLPGTAGLVTAVALIAAACLLLLRREPLRKAALFCTAWILLAWLVHGLSQVFSPWYALHTAAPAALLLGLLAEETVRTLAGGKATGSVRVAALAAGLVVASLVISNAAALPCFTPAGDSAGAETTNADSADNWLTLSRQCDSFLERLKRRIGRTADGGSVEAPRLPRKTFQRAGNRETRVPCLSDYSLQAWADLLFGPNKVRIAYGNPAPPPPAPGERLVIIRSRMR